jgi:ankyrin repeat protein
MKLPPELICMVKFSLTNRDLYCVELTCRYLFWCTVPNKEWQLRKCQLWNQPPSKIISEFKNGRSYCSHVFCWKYRCQYLSLEDVRSWNNGALRWAAENGHLPVVQYLFETFQLTIQDVRWFDNDTLRCAAGSGHLPVVQYLCETFQLTIQDIRSWNNGALRWAAHNGHLPVVQYLCEYRDRENRQLTIQDVRSGINCALRSAAFYGHLPVVQFLRRKYEIDEQNLHSGI